MSPALLSHVEWAGDARSNCWLHRHMSALFDFSSLLTVILLFVCTCAFLRSLRVGIFDDPNAEPPPAPQASLTRSLSLANLFNAAHIVRPQKHDGLRGICWKASRIGERASPHGTACVMMAVHLLLIKRDGAMAPPRKNARTRVAGKAAANARARGALPLAPFRGLVGLPHPAHQSSRCAARCPVTPTHVSVGDPPDATARAPRTG